MKRRWKIGALGLALVMSASLFTGCMEKADVVENLPQFETELTEGEKIAVVTVRDYGQFKIRFFPEQAPKAVENFIGLAEKGFYDELNFHRVIKDFMIQGGDPKGDGSGKESFWGDPFEDEFAPELRNFNGAVSMANSGEDSNGSQFFIVQNSDKYTDEELDSVEESNNKKMAEKVREKYKEVGGTPWLDDAHTVFGQVFEGMDVINKIAECKVTTVTSSSGQSEESKPVDEVLIEKVEIVEYSK